MISGRTRLRVATTSVVAADVPNINAQAEDFWLARQQGLRDVERALVDVELRQGRARLQLAEIGEEIAQPERGVDELRVERGKDDVRHWHHISPHRCKRQKGNRAFPSPEKSIVKPAQRQNGHGSEGRRSQSQADAAKNQQ